MKENLLRKEIVEVLADYKFNSTQTYTAEQFADKIIERIELASQEKCLKMIEEWFKTNGFIMYYEDWALIRQKIKNGDEK